MDNADSASKENEVTLFLWNLHLGCGAPLSNMECHDIMHMLFWNWQCSWSILLVRNQL